MDTWGRLSNVRAVNVELVLSSVTEIWRVRDRLRGMEGKE
jgi:hypothetical protein